MQQLNARKKLGFILLGLVLLCWIAAPILPFFNIPYKVSIIAAVVIIGEILFVITIALLGKEYWGQIKSKLSQIFSFGKKKKQDILLSDFSEEMDSSWNDSEE